MTLIQTAAYALAAIVILSIVYRLLPHRTVSSRKPKLALFPKYVVQNLSAEDICDTLKKLNFKRYGDSNVYVRGHYIGDFSASWARLNVVVDGENVYLHSPLIVILFDTGDLWKVGSALSGSAATG